MDIWSPKFSIPTGVALIEMATGKINADINSTDPYRKKKPYPLPSKAGFNGSFMKSLMTLNIFTFVDMARRENDGVLWDVRRVSSP